MSDMKVLISGWGKATFRDGSFLFWTFLYPIMMATFFYVGLQSTVNSKLDPIPVAVSQKSVLAPVVNYISVLEPTIVATDQEGESLIANKQVIAHVSEELTVTTRQQDGVKASIVAAIVSQTQQGIALKGAAQYLNMSGNFIEKDMQPRNPLVVYFYTLLAMVGLYAMFGVVSLCASIQANETALGARVSVSPQSKSRILFTAFLLSNVINLVSNLLLIAYITLVFRVPLFEDWPSSLLLVVLTNILGSAIGCVVGSFSNLNENAKMGLCVGFSLVSGFAAGLMSLPVKFFIAEHLPWVARYNPITLLSDTLQQINYLNRYEHLFSAVIILTGYTVVLLLFGLNRLRGGRYDSI